MQKLKRCKRRGCQLPAFYQGLCRRCLAPLMADPKEPLRYWPPFMEQATAVPDEKREHDQGGRPVESSG